MPEQWKKFLKSSKATYLLIGISILLAAGLLFFPDQDAGKTEPEQCSEILSPDAYTEQMSGQIRQMVTAITGDPAPHVTITLRSMGKTVYATEDRQSERSEQEYSGDTLNKTQTDGDREKNYILVKSSDGSQKPLIISQTEPEIRGIVIVTKHGGDHLMREKITQAVKTALDLSATQVCVTGGPEYT